MSPSLPGMLLPTTRLPINYSRPHRENYNQPIASSHHLPLARSVGSRAPHAPPLHCFRLFTAAVVIGPSVGDVVGGVGERLVYCID